jgi:hypothetical protein
MSLLRRFGELSRADQWLLAQTSLLLILIRGMLGLFSYATVIRVIRHVGADWSIASNLEKMPRRRVLWAVRAIARRLFKRRPCLPQALAVQFLYLQMGYPAHVQIGVTKSDHGELLAHAWVESRGEVIIGGRLSPENYERLEGLK